MISPMFGSSSSSRHDHLASFAHCAIRGLSLGRTVARGKGQLPNDVIESIFRRLPDVDLVRSKALSSFWNASAEFLLASRNAPFLILPPPREGEERVEDQHRLVNVQERMTYPLKMKTLDAPTQTCIGSSHGWLIFSDYKTLTPVLVNPFTEEKIALPSLKSSLGIVEIEETNNPSQYRYLTEAGWQEINLYRIFESFVKKARLTADPASESGYGVVLMCYHHHRNSYMLLYYKKGDDSWTNFFALEWDITTSRWDWKDVICDDNRIHLLQVPGIIGDYWIYSWEIQNGYPENMILNKTGTLSWRSRRYEGANELSLIGSDMCYLVELKGEFLLVIRYMGCNVKSEDRTSKTWSFVIFKLDAKKNRWKKVKNLGRNVALFVGRNHSTAVSTVEKFGNCVYFTHETTFRDQSGRDMGIYCLRDNRIKPVLDDDDDDDDIPKRVQFSPLPCWLFPTH